MIIRKHPHPPAFLRMRKPLESYPEFDELDLLEVGDAAIYEASKVDERRLNRSTYLRQLKYDKQFHRLMKGGLITVWRIE